MKDSLVFKLLIALILGIVLGLFIPKNIMSVLIVIKYILGQVIFFCVPLIIIGFIAPSITRLKGNASKLLTVSVIVAYISSVLAALMSTIAGYAIIPNLTISSVAEGLKELPPLAFKLDIPPLMSVMSALVFSILLGLASTWTNAHIFSNILEEFQNIVLSIVKKVLIPILPAFIGCTFAGFSYEGSITKQLPIFLIVIFIIMLGHYIWMAVLYGFAGAYSKKNPWDVLRHFGPAYLTAVGTMSSAATLPVTLTCAKKSPILRPDMINFGVPLFANIHLCGSVIAETFLVMTISKILYGKIPSVGTMILFISLLGIFAIGAPGVPGGTVMASLGLVQSVLLFDNEGTALLLAIFALQDSFGTACNVTTDGALTLFLTGFADRKKINNEIKN